MSRGETEVPPPPASSAGVLLGERSRVTIPSHVRSCVGWLRDARPPVSCILSIGREGQIVVSPADSRVGQRRREFFDILRKKPHAVETASGYRLARYFAATWQRAIQEQFQLTLPESLTKSWSPEADAVTLIGFLDRLEIWTARSWAQELGRTATDYDDVIDELLHPSDEP